MTDTSTLCNLAELPTPAPAGTRCFYQNKALGTEGWGALLDPDKDWSARQQKLLVRWRGTLIGPQDPGQELLAAIAPSIGVLPGETTIVTGRFLLWVEPENLGELP